MPGSTPPFPAEAAASTASWLNGKVQPDHRQRADQESKDVTTTLAAILRCLDSIEERLTNLETQAAQMDAGHSHSSWRYKEEPNWWGEEWHSPQRWEDWGSLPQKRWRYT
jgi:hypothetical protein